MLTSVKGHPEGASAPENDWSGRAVQVGTVEGSLWPGAAFASSQEAPGLAHQLIPWRLAQASLELLTLSSWHPTPK